MGSRGHEADAMKILQCLVNAAATALDPVRGNCWRKRQMEIDESVIIDSAPLPMRKRSVVPKCVHECIKNFL